MPEIFVNFMPEPDPKSPTRLTTLLEWNCESLEINIRFCMRFLLQILSCQQYLLQDLRSTIEMTISFNRKVCLLKFFHSIKNVKMCRKNQFARKCNNFCCIKTTLIRNLSRTSLIDIL